MKKFLYILALLGFIFACTEESNPSDKNGANTGENTDPEEEVVDTLLHVHVKTELAFDLDYTAATIAGSCTIENAKDSIVRTSFYLDTLAFDKADIADTLRSITMYLAERLGGSGGAFKKSFSGLKPGTDYFYIASVTVDEEEFFGECRSFRTYAENPSQTGDAKHITEISANLYGYAKTTPEVEEITTMGIILSTEEYPSLENGMELEALEKDKNNMYVVEATGLSSNTLYYYKSYVQYGSMYRCGDIKSFRTADFQLSAQTSSATGIGMYTATLNGKLSVSSKASLEGKVWFRYGTQESLEELLESGKYAEATQAESGIWSAAIDSLDYCADYNYVACAKVHDKEAVGDVVSFRTNDISATVTTGGVSGIGLFIATVSGSLKVDNTEDLSREVWFLMGTEDSLEGLQTNGTKLGASLGDNGSFTYSLTGLSESTKYYYIACAKVRDRELFASEIKSFTTNDVKATVLAMEASGVGLFNASISGSLTVQNPEPLSSEVWFLYGTDSTPDALKAGGRMLRSNLGADGVFSSDLSLLSDNTTYYYLACAKVKDNEFYSAVRSFKTDKISATVTTNAYSNVGLYSATLSGELSVDNEENLSKSVWFLIGGDVTVEGLAANGKVINAELQEDGSFSAVAYSLKANTTYNYVACARVHDKVFYAKYLKKFTTDSISASLTDVNSSVTGLFTASLSASLIVNNQENLSKSVWFLYGTDNTLDGLKARGRKVSVNLGPDGSFSCDLTSLNSSTQYSFVACAKVDNSEFCSDVYQFTTGSVDASVQTGEAYDIGLFTATVNGSLTVNNPEELSRQVWFIYGRDNTLDGLKANGIKYSASLAADGTFSYTLPSLRHSTDYYYVACAKVHDKQLYGEVKGFTTMGLDSSVEALDATDIGLFTATVHGSLTPGNGAGLSKNVGFIYGTESDAEALKAGGTRMETDLVADGSFSLDLTGLAHNTTYYYIAVATLGGVDFYSPVKSFTTDLLQPVVTSVAASDIEYTSATMNGTLTVERITPTEAISLDDISRKVWFYYGSAPTRDGLLAGGKKVLSTLEGDNTFTFNLSGLTHNTLYYFMACADVMGEAIYGDVLSFTTADYYYAGEAVDLGLSVKWSVQNLGAAAAEEYGVYFAWGETEPKASYQWLDYKWCEGTASSLTKYNTSAAYGYKDDILSLESADDVASVKLGGAWRMPTDQEWTELRTGCTWTWTSLNGVYGYNVSASNGNSIFLPAAGYMSGVELSGDGSVGRYWSSSLVSANPNDAWYVYFNSTKAYRDDGVYRCVGFSVRPVTE